ncbi:MAG: efflux RND transporter periplasmic adaptor subunit [Adhaeribacter sp.]
MKRAAPFLAFTGLLLGGCFSGGEQTRPVLSPITESVYAAGTVKATNQYTVYPVVSGILQAILVEAGDTVRAGTPLFRVENRTAGLHTESARLALELSRQNNRDSFGKLREAELQVRTAREKYQLDSVMYRRQQRLWEQNIGTRLEYEQRQLAFTSSGSAYRAARSNLALLRTQLQNELRQARLAYDISRQLQQDFVVTSSLAGRVYDVLGEKGELVSPQTPLAIIGKSNSFLLELEVDEDDIGRVKTGQTLVATLSGYPGQVFEGRVNKIFPIMDERSRIFKVEAGFNRPPAALYPNLTAEANIIIRTKDKALLIPKEYLVEDRYVYLAKDRRRAVKTGLRDYRKVEILAGLDTSDLIFKPR